MHFPSSPAKSSLVSSLLTAAIAKAPFTLIHPEAPPGNPTTQNSRSSISGDDPRLARAKAYLRTARDLGCGQLLGAIVDRIMDTNTLSSSELEEYTRRVTLPLVAFISQDAQMAALDNDMKARFGQLQKKGVDVFLSFLREERNHGRVTQLEVATFLDAALANNDGVAFTET